MTSSPKHPKSHAKVIAGCVIAAVLVFLAVHLLMARGGGSEPADAKPKPVLVDISTARISSVDTVVSAQGTLVPSQGFCARVAAPIGGRLTAVRVREGDRVKAGQVLAVVDTRVQTAQAQSAASALRVSELQAKQAKLSAEAAAVDHSSSVEVARLELESAQTELMKLKNGARPQEIAQSEESAKQALATRDRASTEVERTQLLFEKGIAPKRQLEDSKTALSLAESALMSAKQQLSLVREGARPEEIRSAELKVKSARAALAQAEHGALQVAAKRQESEAANVSIRQKQADFAAAAATVGSNVLRSPIAGIVTRRSLNPGDVADPATPVVEICDSHALDLSANIPAEDGMSVRTGMPVRVSATTAPGKTFAGQVTSVGQVDPQSGLLTLRITVNNPGGVLKVGAFANADIVIRSNPRAVVVPKEAIVTREDRSAVFVVSKDNTAHERKVSVGVEQDSVVEITKGIAPGDRVICLGQYELTDGAEVKPSRGEGR